MNEARGVNNTVHYAISMQEVEDIAFIQAQHSYFIIPFYNKLPEANTTIEVVVPVSTVTALSHCGYVPLLVNLFRHDDT
jgi:hypothetical protein